jgi:hypothetical protein
LTCRHRARDDPDVTGSLTWHGAAAALAAVTVLSACGGAPRPAPSLAQADSQYAANAAGLIDQFHQDVVVSSGPADSLASARSALRDNSNLFAMLVVYSDFGSCLDMVRNVGVAGLRFGRVEATLSSACRYLEHAAKLFSAAATNSDAHALLAASRTTLKAGPLLYLARVELTAASEPVR